MRETEQITRALERFGAKVMVTQVDTEYYIKAIIQPLRYKNKMFLDSQITAIGTVDESCFLYLGPPKIFLTENTPACLIYFHGNAYMVVKTEMLFLGGQHVLNWAILRNYQ